MLDKSHRILIVDDDPDISANLSDILSDAGYETVIANDGRHALETVDQESSNQQKSFDLCLLDFKMPGMDGVELIEQIQARKPELPTIMLTAYAGDDGVRRALDAGTWKVIQKPIDIRHLLGLIDEVVVG